MSKNVIVISGYSGVGKSTLIKHILKTFDNTRLSVSCTTRNPRPGEQNGREYYFLTKGEFEKQIKADAFIEYTECFGNYYGTLKSEIKRILDDCFTCILDIEFAGAYNVLVKHVLGEDINCTGILIELPSIEELKRRLVGRGETNESINTRLDISNLPEHLRDYKTMYKYQIINNRLSTSKQTIIEAIKLILGV